MKKYLFLCGMLVEACFGYADITALTITPLVQDIQYPQKKMVVFQVINQNNKNIQAHASVLSPFASNAFGADHLIASTFNPDVSKSIQLSP